MSIYIAIKIQKSTKRPIFFDDFWCLKQFFEKNITGQQRQLIVLNPFLDSLGNFALKNIGLAPGTELSGRSDFYCQELMVPGCINYFNQKRVCVFIAFQRLFYEIKKRQTVSQSPQKRTVYMKLILLTHDSNVYKRSEMTPNEFLCV